jgi:outer membrane protein OmpA-like peptidoglycan-associated protein
MIRFLTGAATIALLAVTPATAQLLRGGGGLTGGLGGSLGGNIGGLGGHLQGSLDTTIQRAPRAPDAPRRRLGERRVDAHASAMAGLSLDQRMARTRGAVAATRRGLRQVAATASGVPVFVPAAAIAAPPVALSYPAYGGAYYYGSDAMFVGSNYVDVYMDRQYQELEDSLAGTGATVERRGDDLAVLFPADVTFAFDRAEIRPRFYGALNAFARTMNAYPGSDIQVVGHTDAVGADDYNLDLSDRRGRSVADFLAEHRVSPVRLVVEAMGESDPVESNATVEGRAANRRVELIVHPRVGE